MKQKRVLTIVLCALLLCALVPAATVSADGPDGVLASIVLTGGTEKSIYSADSAVEAMILDPNPQADSRYDLPDGLRYERESNTLYMTDFSSAGSTLVLTAMGSDFKISLSGSSSLAAIRSDSMGCGGSITFCGDGALELSSLSDAAIFLNAGGAPDFIRVEPQVRLTAASFAGSAVRVANSSLTEGVISFDTATPDVRAIDSSGEVHNAATTDGAVIDLYTRGGETALFGIEAVIVTVPVPPVETGGKEESDGEDGLADENGEEGETASEPETVMPTTEKLAYNVYRLGATDLQGRYEAQLEEREIESIAAYTPYRTPHDFSLYGSGDGVLCSRVRFGRFTLSAISDGKGSVSVSPTAVGRGGSAVVSYVPNEGYKLDSLLVNGVTVQPVDGKYTIGFVTEDIRIEASFAEAAPVEVELGVPAQTDFRVPADGAEPFVSEPFAAVVRDGAHDAVNLSVVYSLSPELDGLSVDEGGRVSVSNALKHAAEGGALSFTLRAELPGTELYGEASFTVSLEERRVTHVEIQRGERELSESDTLTIPTAGRTTTAEYSTSFTDQYGDRIDEQAQWSSSNTPDGVSLENSTLTVTDACAEESSLRLTASAVSNSAVMASLELRFAASALTITWPTATLAEDPVYGISWEELVSLSGGSAEREGAAVEGSFSLVAESALPNISDSYCIRFSYTDEEGETQTVDSDAQAVTLARKPLSADMITLSPASTPYTGAAVTPAVSLRDGTRALVRDTDFTVGEYQDNVSIGTGSVSVTGMGNYEGTVEKSFAITAIPAGSVKSSVTACKPESTGTEPGFELRWGDTLLVKGTDYDVSFRYDIPAKSGTVTATLKGLYSGTVVSRFDLPDYMIDKGANSSWKKSSSDTLSFHANGALEKFTELTVDGKTVDARYYTTASGSTVVTIKAEYLKTLTPGKHIVGIAYLDGKALAIFSVEDAVRRGVATGDESNLRLWVILLAGSAAALAVLLAVFLGMGRKRKRRRKKRR